MNIDMNFLILRIALRRTYRFYQGLSIPQVRVLMYDVFTRQVVSERLIFFLVQKLNAFESILNSKVASKIVYSRPMKQLSKNASV